MTRTNYSRIYESRDVDLYMAKQKCGGKNRNLRSHIWNCNQEAKSKLRIRVFEFSKLTQ